MKLTIFTDGGARGNPGPAAVGVVIFGNGKKLVEIGERIGVATNNIAEYQALKRGLEEAVKTCKVMKVDLIEVLADSQLIVKQVTGQYKIKNPELAKILAQILQLEKKLPKIKYSLVEREKNWQADRLVNLALDQEAGNK